MPLLATPKADAVYRNAKPKAKEYTIADGGGLYMVVTPSGKKLWDFRYRVDGRRRKVALKGGYEAFSVAEARQEAARLRKLAARGEDPAEARKAGREAVAREEAAKQSEAIAAALTFRKLAEEWERVRQATKSLAYRRSTMQRLERHILPWIGDMPVTSLTAPGFLEVLRKVEQTGHAETAHRVLSITGMILQYGVATGALERNIASDLKRTLTPVQKVHLAAILDPTRLGQLLRDIDAYQGWYATKFAMRILPLVFTRPGELRLAEWAEIDFDRAQWSIPAGRMKMKAAHIVPLSRQVLELLKDLRTLTGESPYLFPTPRQRTKPISNVAILNGLSRMGYSGKEQTAHGFRAIARTHLDENLRCNPRVIEAQLAHKVPDVLGTAYNRTQYLEERRSMMQVWADYLDSLKRKD